MIHVQIDRDGPRVCLSARSSDGQRRMTLTVQRRGGAGLGALLERAAEADEDTSFEVALRGEWEMHQ